MKQTIIHFLTLSILLFVVFAGCGERADEPLPDSLDTPEGYDEAQLHEREAALYNNSVLGFALRGKSLWQFSENSESRNGKNMVLVSLTNENHSADIRAADRDWQGIMPLVRLDQHAGDEEKMFQIGDVQGSRTHVVRFGNDYVRIEKNNIIYEITGKPESVDAVLEEMIWFEPVTDEPIRVNMEHISRRDLSGDIRQWVDNCLALDMTPFADAMVYESKTYIFATWGSRPTGGYNVRIREALMDEHGDIRVRIEYTSPRPDEMVTQAFTHPVDIVVVDRAARNVLFEGYPSGTPRVMTQLRGIDSLREITAGSRSIKVFSPAPDSEVSDPVKVSGIANVHEANVEYRVFDYDGEKIKDGFTTAAAAIAWGYYEIDISLAEHLRSGDRFTIELFYTDMSDGEVRDVVALPLRMK
jgi:hypothetical protein